MTTTVSEKGQITIPNTLRDRLGIRPGQELEVKEDHGRLILSKVIEQDPIDRVYGILKLDKSTDEIIEEMREPVDFP